jgi:cytochrome c oxidase subunit IV
MLCGGRIAGLKERVFEVNHQPWDINIHTSYMTYMYHIHTCMYVVPYVELQRYIYLKSFIQECCVLCGGRIAGLNERVSEVNQIGYNE